MCVSALVTHLFATDATEFFVSRCDVFSVDAISTVVVSIHG
jgi:hypothetical protein